MPAKSSDLLDWLARALALAPQQAAEIHFLAEHVVELPIARVSRAAPRLAEDQ
jgi:hypothetical protein